MDLKKLSDVQLLGRMSKLVRTERKIMHLVLQCIAEIDARKIFLQRAYPSLYDFLIQEFGYSPSAAYRRMEGARLLREIPEVSQQVASGALNLSQISMVRQAVRTIEKSTGQRMETDEKKSILQKIEFLSQKKTEHLLAQEYGASQRPSQKERFHRDESVSLTILFSKEQMQILEKAKHLVDHAVPTGEWADAITYFANNELKKRVGKNSVKVQKFKPVAGESDAHRPTPRGTNHLSTQALDSSSRTAEKEPSSTAERESSSENGETPFSQQQRPPIPQSLRKKMFASHEGCEFINAATGRRCASQRFLEIDHIQPLSAGGGNDEGNLRLLCAFHNRYRHSQNLRPDKSGNSSPPNGVTLQSNSSE